MEDVGNPADYPDVLAVGAVNVNLKRCDTGDWIPNYGSNYGKDLDVVAPGDDILSTLPTYDVYDSINVPAGSTNGGYTNCGDDLAVGGGFAAQTYFYMYNSSPRSATTNEWVGYARNNGGSDNVFFNYAICLTFD